jgi:ABC-type branched-subunit amino acid transport system ATPase component
LVVVGLSVAKLRNSRLGSEMLAVRANERSAAAAGINVARTKLVAFAIAAFIAGIGGCMVAYQQTNVTFDQFDAILGLGVFASAYLAGVTSVSGGILGGMLASGGIVYFGLDQGLHLGGWYDTISGVGLVLTVILNPEGLVGPFHAQLAARRLAKSGAPAPERMAALTSEGRPARSRSEPARTLLTVEQLFVRYGGVVAVDDVSFTVPEGTIVGLIGPNGAGKTTLIDAISGFARSGGTVVLDGKPLDGLRPYQRTRIGLGRTFQAMELWDDLTVAENVGAAFRSKEGGIGGVDDTLAMLELDQVRDRPVGELSQGQRQLVSISRALLGHPKLLLLDEPAAGLDTAESLWLGERLKAVRDRGVTILLVDHDMGLVLSVCDEIHVLNFGGMIASGNPDDIRADPVVTEAYLGSTHSHHSAVGDSNGVVGPTLSDAPSRVE